MPDEVDDRVARAHLAIDDVDLDLAQADGGHDGPLGPGGATRDDHGARQQLLGREGHREDVVDPELEGPQLRLEVAAAGETEDRRDALREGVRGAHALEHGAAVVMVHVDHREVRLPLGQDRVRLGQVACGPHDEEAVVEGELDEVHDQRAIVEHQGAQRSDRAGLLVNDCHGSSLRRPSRRADPWQDSARARAPKERLARPSGRPRF